MLRASKVQQRLWFRSEVDVKYYNRSLPILFADKFTTRHIDPKRFDYQNVLSEALQEANMEPKALSEVPDEKWWRKLCVHLQDKPLSPTGGHLLHRRLVRSLSQRLLVEETYKEFGERIEKETIIKPTFVVGLPRCQGHMGYHMMARSGIFKGFRYSDTLFPGYRSDIERGSAARKLLKGFGRKYPHMESIRSFNADVPAEDVTLQMQVPYSLPWGLLHGADAYLYECVNENQDGVYEYLAKVIRLFNFYYRVGCYSDTVRQEVNQINNLMEIVIDGTKDRLDNQPWMIYSPFAILNIDSLHRIFPDMRIIWAHRALAHCVPSMCSAVAIHRAMYSGHTPTDAEMCTIGEQVCGIYGSGSEHAIKYLRDFDYNSMVHWSNRDVTRSGTRLLMKTLQAFGQPVDLYRRTQAINAVTEYNDQFRPKHSTDLHYFGIHEGIIGQHFQTYIGQFEEYAYEKRFGIIQQKYQPLGETLDMDKFGRDGNLAARQTSMTGQGLIGHYQQQVPSTWQKGNVPAPGGIGIS